MNRRLYRCRRDRRLAGVAGGMAEFFELDPTLVRLLWFASIFFTGGLSIFLYLGLVLIVPLERCRRQRRMRWRPCPKGIVTRGVATGRRVWSRSSVWP